MRHFYLSKNIFILGCAFIVIVTFIALINSHQSIKKQVLNEAAVQLKLQSALNGTLVEQEFLGSVRHTGFIFSTAPISGIVRAYQNNRVDPLTKTDYRTWVEHLHLLLSAYINNNPNIVQIRFIGKANNGREIARVQRVGNDIEVVADDNLQEKGSRDYFKIVQGIPSGQVYISPLTLNREYGEIETPEWSTYRIARPVFDANKEYFGMVIINFDARLLLNSLNKESKKEFKLFLLNDLGQYLLHPNKEKAFAFEYDDEINWNNDVVVKKKNIDTSMTLVNFKSNNKKYYVNQYNIDMEIASYVPPLKVIAAVNKSYIDQEIYDRYALSALFKLTSMVILLILLILYRLLSNLSSSKSKIQAELEATFQGTVDAILSVDEKGNILSWNHAALRLFDNESNVFTLKNVNKLPIDVDSLGAFKRNIYHTFNKKNVEPLDIKLKQYDDKRIMSVMLSPIKTEKDEITSVSAIFRDVTDATLLRKSLQMSNTLLENRNKEMEAFVYTVSHDLKAPLVTISGFGNRLLESLGSDLNEKNKHRLNRIIVNVNHMSKLISELLDISRISRQEPNIEACNLKNCVVNTRVALNQTILDSQAKIKIEPESDLEFYACSSLVIQALQNLISNSIFYTSPNVVPHIKIKAKHENRIYKIAITDNGIGIDSQHHEQIFKLFERLDQGDGTGVGLAIVETIMKKHQGWIDLRSKLNEGSTFTLCFPQMSINDSL